MMITVVKTKKKTNNTNTTPTRSQLQNETCKVSVPVETVVAGANVCNVGFFLQAHHICTLCGARAYLI